MSVEVASSGLKTRVNRLNYFGLGLATAFGLGIGSMAGGVIDRVRIDNEVNTNLPTVFSDSDIKYLRDLRTEIRGVSGRLIFEGQNQAREDYLASTQTNFIDQTLDYHQFRTKVRSTLSDSFRTDLLHYGGLGTAVISGLMGMFAWAFKESEY